MPRGRHRPSPPLHKLLPPSAVAGAAALCAVGGWFFTDPLVLRALVTAAALVAVTGAALMRLWDQDAGHRVTDLLRARENDQWKSEERLAELEVEIDEARELHVILDAKLRANRVELAGLRGEHAALLRRYATAETERAGALEGQRQLAAQAAAGPRALPPAVSTPTASAYLRAVRALDDLTHNAEAQKAKKTLEAGRDRGLAERPAAASVGENPSGDTTTAAAGQQPDRSSSALPAVRVPGASAIVPYSARTPVRRPVAGFDFFGTQQAHGAQATPHRTGASDDTGSAADTDGAAPAAVSAEHEGLADLVAADETLVSRRNSEERVVGQVIDLTEHDETEPLDVGQLRRAIGT